MRASRRSRPATVTELRAVTCAAFDAAHGGGSASGCPQGYVTGRPARPEGFVPEGGPGRARSIP